VLSQLYLSGVLESDPEILSTKKGKLMVKVLLATTLWRETTPGQVQSESVILPITFFAESAEKVKNLRKGAALICGGHLYGTRFEAPQGTKHGVQIVADAVFLPSDGPAKTPLERSSR
jgi:single-stranded DNA-binding protein